MASLVTNSEKNPTKWDPGGMIDTYSGYLKTTVPKSRRQGGARDQADKFLVNRATGTPTDQLFSQSY